MQFSASNGYVHCSLSVCHIDAGCCSTEEALVNVSSNSEGNGVPC